MRWFLGILMASGVAMAAMAAHPNFRENNREPNARSATHVGLGQWTDVLQPLTIAAGARPTFEPVSSTSNRVLGLHALIAHRLVLRGVGF